MHSLEKANIRKTMAILHWPEKSVPKLGPWRDIGMGMSVLCKAIEFLGRTIFSNQIMFSSGSGAKDKKGWNSRKFNGWSSGSGSVTDSWWLFYWSPLEVFMFSHYPGTFDTDIYRIVMLFFRPDHDSQYLDQESWNSPISEMYHREGIFSPCSCFPPSSRPLFLVTGYGDCGGDRVEFPQLFLSNLNLRWALCTFALYLWGLGF